MSENTIKTPHADQDDAAMRPVVVAGLVRMIGAVVGVSGTHPAERLEALVSAAGAEIGNVAASEKHLVEGCDLFAKALLECARIMFEHRAVITTPAASTARN